MSDQWDQPKDEPTEPTEPIWIPWAGHQPAQPYAQPSGQQPGWPPYGSELPPYASGAPAPGPHHRGRWVAAVAGAAVLGAGGVLGVQFALSPRTSAVSGATTAPVAPVQPGGGAGLGAGADGDDQGGIGVDPFSGQGGTSPAAAQSTTPATTAQQTGVVDITTVLGLQGSRAAGTGMILTNSGEVLTNNHVIAGATKISVTVVTTGDTYTASVVGYSVTNDVAVLRLDGASGLQPVSLATSTPAVGDAVVGVGNAGGAGGTPSAAAGTVTALDQEITAQDDSGGAEQLSGLIQTDAPILAGDSGGPLYDSSDHVVGMDTAASAGRTSEGFAIPIDHALAVAKQIEDGSASASVHVGGTAFLGIQVLDRQGAEVAAVVSGSPAEAAGLAAGDVITAVDGHAVVQAAGVSAALQPLSPGQSVAVSWTDTTGRTHHATVTLATGPAQ